MRPNGEAEGPAEASGRTQVERSSSRDPHSGRQATRAHTLSRDRGAKQEAPHGALQRLLDGATSPRRMTEPRKLRGKHLKEQPEKNGPNGNSDDSVGDLE